MKVISIFKKILQYVKFIFERVIYSPIEIAKRQGVKFGKNCIVNGGVSFGSEPYLITIGDNFYSSSNIQFITHDGAINVFRNLYLEYKDADLMAPIKIGDNVFLGYGVIVLPGSVIEDNVIVGAASLVKGNLQARGVYAGVPAKYICSIDQYLEKNKARILNTKNMLPAKKMTELKYHFKV